MKIGNCMTRHSLASLMAAVALLAGSGAAHAFMCTSSPSAANDRAAQKAAVGWALGKSAAVFAGKVMAIDYVPARDQLKRQGEMRVIRFVAERWWKGEERHDVTLQTHEYRLPDDTRVTIEDAYPYEVGKTYLVYAYAAGDELHADVCTRTRPFDGAADEIAALDALKAASPAASPAR